MRLKNNQFYMLLILLCFNLFQGVRSETVIYEDVENKFVVEQLTKGLGVIWGMAFISKNEMMFTQRNGKIGILNLTNSRIVWMKNMPDVFHEGQGGLLDVAVSPHFKTTQLIFFTYSKKLGSKSVTALATAQLLDGQLQNWKDILLSQSQEKADYHYGSRIAFDDNGHVFFSIGDRGTRSNSQNLSNHAGSILRLNIDGSIPFDNPFVNSSSVLPEIWSYGHRNPQGLVYDKLSKRLWAIEHGPRGGDEINLIIAGKNYGWPIISYGKEYWGPISVGEGTHKKGMEQPVKYYVPSIAPSSLMIYSGRAFTAWKGNLFAGALKLKHINRVVLDSNAQAISEQRLLSRLKERIRCLVENSKGLIYVATDSGKILRLRPH